MMNDSKMINVEEEEERVRDIDKISNEEHVVANIGGDLDQKLSLHDQKDQKSKYDEEDDEGIYVHPHRLNTFDSNT